MTEERLAAIRKAVLAVDHEEPGDDRDIMKTLFSVRAISTIVVAELIEEIDRLVEEAR